jgi:hypothetical protein
MLRSGCKRAATAACCLLPGAAAGENPYLVADRFISEYELPMEFKEQARTTSPCMRARCAGVLLALI